MQSLQEILFNFFYLNLLDQPLLLFHIALYRKQFENNSGKPTQTYYFEDEYGLESIPVEIAKELRSPLQDHPYPGKGNKD